MDTGGAPPIEMSLEAHAGCLSFEFSTPKQSLIVVNCGMPATSREDGPDGVVLRAAHDGYADRFGIVHQRLLTLAADGSRLDGEDIFLDAGGGARLRAAEDEFAVRFHLHPAVRATRLTDGHGVMLMTPNKEVWTFSAYAERAELEDSVYLAGSEGPRRTTQIVIHGHACSTPRVPWSLQQVQTAGAARQPDEEEPRLPL